MYLICMVVLFFYVVYQLLRNDAIFKLRVNWSLNSDERYGKYTYYGMFFPSLANWLGMRYPMDKHYKQ